MEDLKISDEEPPRPVYGGGPLVWAMAARQMGRRFGKKTIPGVDRSVDELAENKLIDRGEDFEALQCQLGGATRQVDHNQCCGSGMFYPGSGSDHCSIPDPGGKKAPDPGSDLFLYKGYLLTNFVNSLYTKIGRIGDPG
jgi:hypothetical protein